MGSSQQPRKLVHDVDEDVRQLPTCAPDLLATAEDSEEDPSEDELDIPLMSSPTLPPPIGSGNRTLDDQIRKAILGVPLEESPKEKGERRLVRRVDLSRGGLVTGASVVLYLLSASKWMSANDISDVLAIQASRARKVLKTLREEGMLVSVVVERRGRPPTVVYAIPRKWFKGFQGAVDGRLDPRTGE